MQRCEGKRSLIGQEDCVQVEVHSLEKYLTILKEKILKELSRSRIPISMEEVSMEEVKKKYIESIERRMKEILFMDSLEKLQRK